MKFLKDQLHKNEHLFLKGGKLEKTQDGTIQLSSLGPRETEMVKTEKVELTTVKPSIVCVGGT